jgi:hypothetical protein
METTSSTPTAAKTKIIRTFNSPLVSPWGRTSAGQIDNAMDCRATPSSRRRNQCHGQSLVHVGIAAPQKRARDRESSARFARPSQSCRRRDQAEPICEKDENENRREEPKRFFDQVRPNDTLEKIVKTLNQPFPEILRAGRDFLNSARGQSREQDQRQATAQVITIELVIKKFVVEQGDGSLRKRMLGMLGMARAGSGRFIQQPAPDRLANVPQRTALACAVNNSTAVRIEFINDIGLERCVSGTPVPLLKFNV